MIRPKVGHDRKKHLAAIDCSTASGIEESMYIYLPAVQVVSTVHFIGSCGKGEIIQAEWVLLWVSTPDIVP